MEELDNLKPKANNDHVLVRLFPKKQKTQGRIVVPDFDKKVIQKGTVVSVGPGLDIYNNNEVITISLRYKEGQIVGVPPSGWTPIESSEDGDLISIKAQDIVVSYE